jgi:AcrR family transcriptional regulator
MSSPSKPGREEWIAAGYAIFARQGPEGLKVEALARQVGKSKSSFYHHFADLEGFTAVLLDSHRERASRLAARERACPRLVPDLLLLIVEAREDLLFSRQLRVKRQQPEFRHCFEAVNELVGDAMLHLWAEEMGLRGQPRAARQLLDLVLENFYLRLTEESLTYDWLLALVQEVRAMLGNLLVQGKEG